MAIAYLILALAFSLVVWNIFRLIDNTGPNQLQDIKQKRGILKMLTFVFLFTYLFRASLLGLIGKWNTLIPNLYVRY